MTPANSPSPWLTTREAAARARVGPKTIYKEVAADRLRAARVGNRRDIRLLASWVDEWLERAAAPIEVASGTSRHPREEVRYAAPR